MADDSLPCSQNIVGVPNEEFLESWGSTYYLLAKHRYTWTIHNFSFSVCRPCEYSVSPTFSVGINNNKSEWRLKLYPYPLSMSSSKLDMDFFLELIAFNMNVIKAGYKIHILNDKGEKVNRFSSNDSKMFKKGENNRLLTIRQDEENEAVFHDQLIIVCEIMYKIGSENNTQERLPTLPSSPAIDFTFLLENKQLSDVTLCVSGKEFPAHKVILSARSPVFRAMFQCDMEESRNNRVEITDMDEEGLSEMLRYMYTGEIKALKKMAPHLLGIAEKYDLEDLKIRCEEALLKILSLENVVELYILSDTFRAKNLNIQVKKFIKTHVSVIVIRPEFQTMVRTHPHLGIEAFCLIGSGKPSS